ncbi:hypothetical protein [Curtobacterium sp. 458]|uniref:hypothetical protein n=1 Tax=Curtobacterium sp. 458 TaxID=3050069 RepID=UPI0025B55835|nr:hypothetical protein [Curtobacterium sp. 458]WJY01632.1 hypothetical protein QPJ90_08005 [Curtobacterium sp. 458]
MHDDATSEATEPTSTHDTAPTAAALDPQAPVRDLCMSVFDRWRCGREDGHAGPHSTGDEALTASWNDTAAGRRLRWR